MVAIREKFVVRLQMRAQYHPAAECLEGDCTWDYPQSLRARREAKAHTKASGHSTRVVQEDTSVYVLVPK